jgi:TPP-dependent pyruvate/acetoin dehydrogenase alpha subunit
MEEKLRAEVKAQVEEAVQEFESPKDWAQDAPFAHVYGTEHDTITEQRADFLANAESDGDHG